VPGRRHLLALLAAVALLGATASVVVLLHETSSSAASIDDDAATVTRPAATPAAVAGRVTRAGEQIVNGDVRPHRLTGLAMTALLLVLALRLRAGARPVRRGHGTLAPETTSSRITPPRAPPLLLRTAS
jgi:hypothetical protein